MCADPPTHLPTPARPGPPALPPVPPCRHLGTTLRVREARAKAFRRAIGEYVDSKNARDSISTWPLVRVCRIRHAWPVLATGALWLACCCLRRGAGLQSCQRELFV